MEECVHGRVGGRKDAWEVVKEDGPKAIVKVRVGPWQRSTSQGTLLLAQFIQYSTSNQISQKTPRTMRVSPSFASMAILLLPSKGDLSYCPICQLNTHLFGLVRIVGMRRILMYSLTATHAVCRIFVVREVAFAERVYPGSMSWYKATSTALAFLRNN